MEEIKYKNFIKRRMICRNCGKSNHHIKNCYEPKTSFKWYELIVEVDDYTEEDIKEYFPEAEEQFISLMHEECK